MSSETPVLRFKEGSTVVPGDRLGTIRQARPGIGTYVKGGHIYASLLGSLTIQEMESNEMDTDDNDEKKVNFVC